MNWSWLKNVKVWIVAAFAALFLLFEEEKGEKLGDEARLLVADDKSKDNALATQQRDLENEIKQDTAKKPTENKSLEQLAEDLNA